MNLFMSQNQIEVYKVFLVLEDNLIIFYYLTYTSIFRIHI